MRLVCVRYVRLYSFEGYFDAIEERENEVKADKREYVL